MKLVIKNMVCPRCVESVGLVFQNQSIPVHEIGLGWADVVKPVKGESREQLSQALHEKGFELIQDRESELVEQVKALLIEYIHHIEESKSPDLLSEFIADKLFYNYSYLSKLFTEHEGITVETLLIRMKIERVKELLSYDKWTLSEIAWKLKYSSVQYLSNQFKKVTGKTVTQYLNQPERDRTPLDQL
jgi:YesN/AraC family two-component response regulator